MTSTASTRPRPSVARDELLRDDRLQDQRELRADLRLLLLGEDVDDAVDRLHGAELVCRVREHEVAGLGDGQRRLDRSRGRAFRRSARRRGPGAARGAAPSLKLCVSAYDLALVDDAALVLVHELDRILERDDVLVARRC